MEVPSVASNINIESRMTNRAFGNQKIRISLAAYRELILSGMLHEGQQLSPDEYEIEIEPDVYQRLKDAAYPGESFSDTILRCVKQRGGTN
jgi:hypothetical protein